MGVPPVLVIDGELRLRPLRDADAADVFSYSTVPEFCRYLAANPPRDIDDSRTFIRGINAEVEAGRRIYWAIEYRGRVQGTMGLLNISAAPPEAEIGFGIAVALWGKGIINRCMVRVIAWGCEELRLTRLIVGTDEGNGRALGFAEKSGFTRLRVESGKIYLHRPCGA